MKRRMLSVLSVSTWTATETVAASARLCGEEDALRFNSSGLYVNALGIFIIYIFPLKCVIK